MLFYYMQAIIMFFIMGVGVYSILHPEKFEKDNTEDWNNVEETSYLVYSALYGENAKIDATFTQKVNKIYELIMKEKCDDIKYIAKEAWCTYQECIIKIDYLKHNNLIPQNYYVDHINGYIKKCDKKDIALIKKYAAYLYKQKLQIRDIAVKLPHATSDRINELMEEVKTDIKYLIEKDLVEGVIYNEVDDRLIYFEDQIKGKDLVTIKCPNCGANIELERGSKKRCEYCKCIVDSKEQIK